MDETEDLPPTRPLEPVAPHVPIADAATEPLVPPAPGGVVADGTVPASPATTARRRAIWPWAVGAAALALTVLSVMAIMRFGSVPGPIASTGPTTAITAIPSTAATTEPVDGPAPAAPTTSQPAPPPPSPTSTPAPDPTDPNPTGTPATP